MICLIKNNIYAKNIKLSKKMKNYIYIITIIVKDDKN